MSVYIYYYGVCRYPRTFSHFIISVCIYSYYTYMYDFFPLGRRMYVDSILTPKHTHTHTYIGAYYTQTYVFSCRAIFPFDEFSPEGAAQASRRDAENTRPRDAHPSSTGSPRTEAEQ